MPTALDPEALDYRQRGQELSFYKYFVSARVIHHSGMLPSLSLRRWVSVC